ncbi:hypothetical protein ENBRE01_2884, partial [Enteropsectra breve]
MRITPYIKGTAWFAESTIICLAVLSSNKHSECHVIPNPTFSEPCEQSDELKDKLKVQKAILEHNCAECKKPILEELFPYSYALEKASGISKYPYEYEVLNLFDLLVHKCHKGCPEALAHRSCFLYLHSKREGDYFYNGFSRFKPCPVCDMTVCKQLSSDITLRDLIKCTKAYEFAYVYKTLMKYKTDIIQLAARQRVSKNEIENILYNVNKCEFKGKNYLSSSLEFLLLSDGRPSSVNNSNITALCNYIKHARDVNQVSNFTFWKTLVDKCKDADEINHCINLIAENITEESLKNDQRFINYMLFSYIDCVGKNDSAKFLYSFLFSERYFLLHGLSIPASDTVSDIEQRGGLKTTFPGALKILREMENNFQNTAKTNFFRNNYNGKARVISLCISIKQQEHIWSEITPILIYLKRLCKLASSKAVNDTFCNKKEYLQFCESLVLHLMNNRDISFQHNMTLLKICLFYHNRYGTLQQRSFMGHLFSDLEDDYEEYYMEKDIMRNHLSKYEFREMMALIALNCDNTGPVYYKSRTELNENTKKYLAQKLSKCGKLLMHTGLENVPQICKKYCLKNQYSCFLQDLCFNKHLPYCAINKEVLEDFAAERKIHSHTSCGLLPLLLKFYILLNCQTWTENQVLEWCESTNYNSLLEAFSNEKYKAEQFLFVKRHFKTILRHILDKTKEAGSINEEIQAVVRCWQEAYDFENPSIVDMFEALAGARNGFYHANIFYLAHRKTYGV